MGDPGFLHALLLTTLHGHNLNGKIDTTLQFHGTDLSSMHVVKSMWRAVVGALAECHQRFVSVVMCYWKQPVTNIEHMGHEWARNPIIV